MVAHLAELSDIKWGIHHAELSIDPPTHRSIGSGWSIKKKKAKAEPKRTSASPRYHIRMCVQTPCGLLQTITRLGSKQGAAGRAEMPVVMGVMCVLDDVVSRLGVGKHRRMGHALIVSCFGRQITEAAHLFHSERRASNQCSSDAAVKSHRIESSDAGSECRTVGTPPWTCMSTQSIHPSIDVAKAPSPLFCPVLDAAMRPLSLLLL